MIRSLALISPYAPSIVNFRGPLVQALVARGVRVFALAPDYDEALRARVRALGAEPVDYPLERTGISIRRDAVALFSLYRILRRLRPDASLGYFVKPVIYGALAAWAARVPRRYSIVEGLGYIFTDQEVVTVRRKLLRGLLLFLFRLAFRATQRVFFLNPDDLAQFVGAGLIPRERTHLIGPIGVELADYPAAPPPTLSASSPPVFLLIGRLLREKGVHEFVEAARLVREAGVPARFVIVGGHDANPGAIPLAQLDQWVADGLIEWPGQVADVRPFVEAASVYVLPSWREGFPRSTQEAMAMGRAVITTDVPGCRETVVEGRNGLLVPVRDPRALADAMLRLIADPGLVARMGLESRRIAEQRFDVHDVNRRFLAELGIAD